MTRSKTYTDIRLERLLKAVKKNKHFLNEEDYKTLEIISKKGLYERKEK